VFAVREVEVAGATPAVQDQVREALRPVVGQSLLDVDEAMIEGRLASVPAVKSVQFDRAFPSTLKVVVTPEQPVLLLRHRAQGWVVSATGRVLRRVDNTRVSRLPRAWVGDGASVNVGATLSATDGGAAAAAIATVAAAHFPERPRFVRVGDRTLTLVLHAGTEIRLGDLTDARLKLAIARRILAATGVAIVGGYVDVSVPERPVVAPANPQLAGGGLG
jgi:cell division protein FtsQ